MIATNNWEVPSLSCLVDSSYALRARTGQRELSSGKDGKKNSVIALPLRDCFDSAFGVNTTPSGLYRLALMSNWDRSAERDGLVNAMSMTVFRVRLFRESDWLSPRALMKSSTIRTSHVLVYRGKGGLLL